MKNNQRLGIRFPRSARLAPESNRPQKRIDIVLQRIAWCSQIALVLAAILGYVYTVRPVHQKQLLDEQIAQRTISLRDATIALEKLKSEASQLRAENSKLGTEAKSTYSKLRDTISVEILSMDRCATLSDGKPRKSTDVPVCVSKFAKEKIAPSLLPKDRELLFELIDARGPKMIRSNVDVTRQFSGKPQRLNSEIKKIEEEIENAQRDVRAEIHRMRVARAGGRSIEPDPTTGRIVIRTEEDQLAYDNYVNRHRELNRRLFKLRDELINIEVDREMAYGESLRKISSEIFYEFRKRAERN